MFDGGVNDYLMEIGYHASNPLAHTLKSPQI